MPGTNLVLLFAVVMAAGYGGGVFAAYPTEFKTRMEFEQYRLNTTNPPSLEDFQRKAAAVPGPADRKAVSKESDDQVFRELARQRAADEVTVQRGLPITTHLETQAAPGELSIELKSLPAQERPERVPG